MGEGYGYTPSGQIGRAVDGKGQEVRYHYNSLGKVRERIDQKGGKETFQYDAEGNLSLYVDRNGNWVERQYNVLGNLVYEKATDEKGEHPSIRTYRYDSLGRLIQGVCDGHSYEYHYDERGNLKEKRSSGKRLISYLYDEEGRIREIQDPGGVRTWYEYDLLGRKSRIHSENGVEVAYRYDCLNRLKEIGYGNGIRTRYMYDENGEIKSLETGKGEESLLSFQYRYDGNGNRIEKTGEQKLVGGERSHLQVRYEYDVRGQLVEENGNGACYRYTYDGSGNRVKKESPEGSIRYGYNEKNQLLREEGIGGTRTYEYDPQGNVILEEGERGRKEYRYNSRNQLIQVRCSDGQEQKNRYDGEQLRCEMEENERLLRFVYHKGELLYEGREGGEGQPGQISYHLGHGVEGREAGGEISYYHRDEQLSTVLMTDRRGEIQAHYQYDTFGVELERKEQEENRLRYTGQQYDTVTEQYYLRARYYNPVVGRFMQEDVYQGDGMNLYA